MDENMYVPLTRMHMKDRGEYVVAAKYERLRDLIRSFRTKAPINFIEMPMAVYDGWEKKFNTYTYHDLKAVTVNVNEIEMIYEDDRHLLKVDDPKDSWVENWGCNRNE